MILLGTLQASSVKFSIPWRGTWSAEVDLVLGDDGVLPSGKTVLTVGTQACVCTIDPRGSGKFGPTAKVRVSGGAGAWDSPVGRQHFHNDAGIYDAVVIGSTAKEVGEVIAIGAPARLGVDYVRCAGPASSVLAGRDWNVTLQGITSVIPRVQLSATPDVEVLSWDANAKAATVACDGVLEPGTILVDVRFGTLTVREVEQTFDDSGVRATAWCHDDTQSDLVSMIAGIATYACGVAQLKTYEYRVVLQDPDGRLTLQSVDPDSGAPDEVKITPWFGIPGVVSAKVTPSTLCHVGFIAGDPSRPVVVRYESAPALALELGGPGGGFAARAELIDANYDVLKAACDAAVTAAVPNDGGKAAFGAFKTALEFAPVAAALVKVA